MYKIAIIGADLIGGATGLIFAQNCPSVKVTVIDDNEEIISQWNSDNAPILEPTVGMQFKKCIGRNLEFVKPSIDSIQEADIIFICAHNLVKLEEKGESPSEWRFLNYAANIIGDYTTTSKVVVERSMLPVGASEVISQLLKQKKPNLNFEVVSNPPYIYDGAALQDFLFPSHVILGRKEDENGIKAADFVSSAYENWIPKANIIQVSILSAEMARLCSSALFSQTVTSINSLLEICEVTSADISEIFSFLSNNLMSGPLLLDPNLGFYFSFLHEDVENLVQLSKSLKLPEIAEYWENIIEMNKYQKKRLTKLVLDCFFSSVVEGKKIAFFGTSFNRNVGHPKESPTFYICEALLNEGAKISIWDTSENLGKIKNIFSDVSMSTSLNLEVVHDPFTAVVSADGIILFSYSKPFKSAKYNEIISFMQKPASFFDFTRNMPHKVLSGVGFNVHTVGQRLQNSVNCINN